MSPYRTTQLITSSKSLAPWTAPKTSWYRKFRRWMLNFCAYEDYMQPVRGACPIHQRNSLHRTLAKWERRTLRENDRRRDALNGYPLVYVRATAHHMGCRCAHNTHSAITGRCKTVGCECILSYLPQYKQAISAFENGVPLGAVLHYLPDKQAWECRAANGEKEIEQ